MRCRCYGPSPARITIERCDRLATGDDELCDECREICQPRARTATETEPETSEK
jgi:hypothetical protein